MIRARANVYEIPPQTETEEIEDDFFASRKRIKLSIDDEITQYESALKMAHETDPLLFWKNHEKVTNFDKLNFLF